MIKEAVYQLMRQRGVPYQYGEFRDVGEGIPDCYFVGEAVEIPTIDEGGMVSGTFVLNGWAKTPAAHAALIEHQERIRRDFMEPVHVSNDMGAAVIAYSHAIDVPSDVENVMRCEVNLTYSEINIANGA